MVLLWIVEEGVEETTADLVTGVSASSLLFVNISLNKLSWNSFLNIAASLLGVSVSLVFSSQLQVTFLL